MTFKAKSMFRMAALTCFSAAAFLLSCKEEEIIVPKEPYLASHLRYMLKEEASFAVNEIPSDAEVTFNLGDGTVETVKGSASVSHRYTTAGDYDVTATWGDGQKLEKTIRVYPLLALSVAMEQFKDPQYKKIWVMAHRSHTTDPTVPENSCAAVRAAVTAGVEIVELDTRLTSDGYVVVCHDETVNSTTTGNGKICDLTLAQIKSFNMKDRKGNETKEKMPTLEEYLKEARGKVYVNMDYSPRDASSAQVYEVVRKLDMLEQVFFYCNTAEKAEECFELNPLCHVYPWYTQYKVLEGHPWTYFVQGSATSNNMDVAVGAGAILSLCMRSVVGDGNAYTLNISEVEGILTDFPDTKMLQTDTPAELIVELSARGRR